MDWTCSFLEEHDDENPRLSAEWLLSAATGLSRVQIYMNFDKPLTQEELDLMHKGVVRRAKGEPLQYVTGEMAFRHIVVKCTPEVLIPRPETELLVEEALVHIDEVRRLKRKDPVYVLEVGCGTGCISLSIASERPFTQVVATDISNYATSLAQRNVEALDLDEKVKIVECDLVDGVDKELYGLFDVLISNPPYIPTEVVDTLPREVEVFEPHLALDGGEDGLDIFRRLVDVAPHMLCKGGLLCVELFETKLQDARMILEENIYFENVVVKDDLTRRNRMIVATRK